ncbi:MAG: hypothetical protein ACREAU_01230 [Nitrosopumilaceae archaeon]
MKLSEIKDFTTQDLIKWGITPHREDLEPNELYIYPPFVTLTESGDTTPLPIHWHWDESCLHGDFQTEEYSYQIQICVFTYPFQQKVYKGANVAFVCYKDGQPTTEVIPTQYFRQVMSTVQNGISEKIVMLGLDAITLVATNNIATRMKVYNALADKYGVRFGKIYKNIKTLTGVATIIVSHRVPENAQQELYKFALERSSEK